MGANVHAQGGGFGTALQAAASNGHLAIVKLLLGEGTDVNARGRNENAPAWHLATVRGYPEIARMLLAQGAQLNVESEQLRKALYAAATHHDITLVRLLLDRRGDIQGWEASSALEAAIGTADEEAVQWPLLAMDPGSDSDLEDEWNSVRGGSVKRSSADSSSDEENHRRKRLRYA
jgi:ankyrin repeat protein